MITASAFRSVMPCSCNALRTKCSSSVQFEHTTSYAGTSATGAACSGDGGLFNVTGSTVSCRASLSLSEAVTLGASKESDGQRYERRLFKHNNKKGAQLAPESLRVSVATGGYSHALEFTYGICI